MPDASRMAIKQLVVTLTRPTIVPRITHNKKRWTSSRTTTPLLLQNFFTF